MANMRAVAMAAPSSSVQATAWPSGTCWPSGLAGGSLPVIRLQPTRITFWAASTAISPVASFSARTERPSPFSAIGSPRARCQAPRPSAASFARKHLTAQPLTEDRSRCQAAADPALPRHQRRARRRGSSMARTAAQASAASATPARQQLSGKATLALQAEVAAGLGCQSGPAPVPAGPAAGDEAPTRRTRTFWRSCVLRVQPHRVERPRRRPGLAGPAGPQGPPVAFCR